MPDQIANRSFESVIDELTKPLNGQYPRPWMTDLSAPLSAKVLIVGRNQAKGYDVSRLSHTRHMDALFNRNGESCRKLYNEMTGDSPSPTRRNIDRLRKLLEQEGVHDVLETNVICYSTPMSSDLNKQLHVGGEARGTEIFRTILRFIRPSVIISHGSGTIKDLGKVLGYELPTPEGRPGAPISTLVDEVTVFSIPSLAPPEWNKWASGAAAHLEAVANEVACILDSTGKKPKEPSRIPGAFNVGIPDLKAIESATLEYLHAEPDDEEWPVIKSNFHVLAAEPHTILELVAAARTNEQLPSLEEMQALAKLVRDLTGYIRMKAGDQADAVRDDLLAQTRQLLGVTGL